MKACLSICLLISAVCWSQTTPAPKAAPAKKPTAATAAKPAAAAGPSRPTAIIETTAGKLTCTLFPDIAPIGVAAGRILRAAATLSKIVCREVQEKLSAGSTSQQ